MMNLRSKSTKTRTRRQALYRVPDNYHIPEQSKRLALRIRAIGNLDGWHWIISDTDRRPLATDCGFLPPGFAFNRETALLYCLAQVHRYIKANLPYSRVVALCTTPRLPVEQRREARRAA